LSTGASQSRPSAEQQTRTYLRWKAAIALGKALTCGLIYALTGLPLWPVFALLVFWLHWVPIVGSAIAIISPLPLVGLFLYSFSFTLLFYPFSFTLFFQPPFVFSRGVAVGRPRSLPSDLPLPLAPRACVP
jgi:predicted PurR-regulated permease PerM